MAVFGSKKTNGPRADITRIAQWFAGSKGQRQLDCERQLLGPQLQRMFGSYALLYNSFAGEPWQSQVKKQVRLGQEQLGPDVQCNEVSWPIQPDSVDLVVLQHSLEFAASPHDLLHEATQSVRPGGYVVIVAINPYSFFALGRFLAKDPWRQARCYSSARISDWLSLLGFQLERCSHICYRPLALHSDSGKMNFVERFLYKRQWPLGNCYMLVARKMRPGSFLQTRRKLALDKLMPLPAATATRSGGLDKHKHHE